MSSFIPLDHLRPTAPGRGYAPFALGFRPFFLAAGLSGVVLMALWLAILKGKLPPPAHFSPIAWHAHEMIFGFAAAVIAGFLLTASKNWTGVQTIHGAPLALLALLWLAGRIVFFLPLPAEFIAVVDLAFLPLLAAAVAAPILRARHTQSLVFVVILLVLSVANGFMHLDALGIVQGVASLADTFGINFVMVLIALMGGRVIPFFTERALPGFVTTSRDWVESMAVASIALHAVMELVAFGTWLSVATGVAAATINGIRLSGWWTPHLLRVPLLWTLHLAYAWLIVGLLLRVGTHMGFVAPTTALHALTVGCLGTVTLSMMSRVSMGHTGREIRVGGVMVASFLLMTAAGLLRVLGPLLLPQMHMMWLMLSGYLWIAAFAVFAFVYIPILIRARIDGQPG